MTLLATASLCGKPSGCPGKHVWCFSCFLVGGMAAWNFHFPGKFISPSLNSRCWRCLYPCRSVSWSVHTATPPVQKCDGKVREGAPREHAKEGFNHTEWTYSQHSFCRMKDYVASFTHAVRVTDCLSNGELYLCVWHLVYIWMCKMLMHTPHV